MKTRLGFAGKFLIGFEERRVAREEMKQVLRNALKAQTEELLNRNQLELSIRKERDYASYVQIMTKIEEYLMTHEAETQHTLNDLLDKFEDAFTDQYMKNEGKLGEELKGRRITQEIYDMRIKRARERYEDAMDKCTRDMKLIIDKHKTQMESALRTQL